MMPATGAAGPVYNIPLPRLVRWLGGRWRDERRSFRMRWGDLSFGKRGWSLQLCLFDERRFSLHVHLFWVQVYISLPFLKRWAHEPKEIMESWGLSYTGPDCGGLHLTWGTHYKIVAMPWHDWVHMSHEVRRADGSWTPFVGSWERDKEPDNRHTETYPYRYLLRSGEKQEVLATIFVERRTWRLRLLKWTRALQHTRHAIDVSFSDEVGEGHGSWKGGTIGCGYDLRPDETPYECLRRMERERKFPR